MTTPHNQSLLPFLTNIFDSALMRQRLTPSPSCIARAPVNTCTALFLLSLYYHGEGKQRQAWIRSGESCIMELRRRRRDADQ